MSRLPRFFLPDLTVGEVTLDGQEAHHLLNVRRLRKGDKVELFNGVGHSGVAIVNDATRRDVKLHVEAIEESDEDEPAVTLAVGFPKPDRARWMVEKATELGVFRLVPLVTEFSRSSGKPVKVEKLQQYVIDACKQSRRNHLMQIDEPIEPGKLIAQHPECELLLAEQTGSRVPQLETTGETIVFIGPEGGFSRSEQQTILDAGATPVAIGGNILRVETAALAFATRLLQ